MGWNHKARTAARERIRKRVREQDRVYLPAILHLRAQGHGYRAIAESLTAHSMTKAERKAEGTRFLFVWLDRKCPPVPKRPGGFNHMLVKRILQRSRDPEASNVSMAVECEPGWRNGQTRGT